MGDEYRGRVFKSGNSMALRLPKGLGVAEGTEMRLVREAAMSFRAAPVDAPKRKFNIAKVAGSARDLAFIKDEDRLLEERALSWQDGAGRAER